MKLNTRIMSLIMALFFFLTPMNALADEPEAVTVETTAAVLTKACDTTEEKAMAIYRYISRHFKYDYELCNAVLAGEITHYTPDPQWTLENRKGVCYDFAVLFAAMLHSQGIQVKLVKGYHNEMYHAWNSVYDVESDRWVQLDVTMDLRRGRHRKKWRAIDAADYIIQSEVFYSG